MPFLAETNALTLLSLLREPLKRLQAHDPKLADEARRAGRSIALNAAEGRGRRGRDRTHHFAVAYASGRELRMALAIAEAEGLLAGGELGEVRQVLDRQLALLWGLQRR
ncbi:MAG: four helix bundle protein [Planctomycetes bacterium]|nr:four helix bundle protein [Planctomycetota bacterium]